MNSSPLPESVQVASRSLSLLTAPGTSAISVSGAPSVSVPFPDTTFTLPTSLGSLSLISSTSSLASTTGPSRVMSQASSTSKSSTSVQGIPRPSSTFMPDNKPAADLPDEGDGPVKSSTVAAPAPPSTNSVSLTRNVSPVPPPATPPASSTVSSKPPLKSSRVAVKSTPPPAEPSSTNGASPTFKPLVNPFSGVSSNPVSTSNSLTNAPTPLARVTSTIIDFPESTFSKAVSITITNSAGQASLVSPPFVTVLSTSTQPDGSLVTYTHVIANPTGFAATNQAVRSPSVFSNRGAMAGIFIAVGIFAAIVTAAICIITRRRRRQRRRQEWFSSIGRPNRQSDPLPLTDPFRDPPLFSGGPVSTGQGWSERGERNLLDDEVPSPVIRSEMGSPGLAGVGAMRVINPAGPHHVAHDVHPGSQSLGVALSSDHRARPQSRVSMTPSSPSIYPASLAPSDTESLHGDETETSSTPLHNDLMMSSLSSPIAPPPIATTRHKSVDSAEMPPVFQVQTPSQILSRGAPIRPRRSLQRPKGPILADHGPRSPLTPLSAMSAPSSASSHTNSNPMTPSEEPARHSAVRVWDQSPEPPLSGLPQLKNPMDLLAKRTLLDVRPCPGREFANGNV